MSTSINPKQVYMTPQNQDNVRQVKCPTCKGEGQIPKDSKEEYIALIPLSDKRLRPRRTTLKILASVTVCLIFFGLLIFFLTPRSIKLSSSEFKIHPYYAVVDDDSQTVFLALENHFNVTNLNYVGFYVERIRVDAMTDLQYFVLPRVNLKKHQTVPLKSVTRLSFKANYTISEDDISYIVFKCKSNGENIHQISIEFTITVIGQVLGQSVEVTLDVFQLVDCYPTTNSTYIPMVT